MKLPVKVSETYRENGWWMKLHMSSTQPWLRGLHFQKRDSLTTSRIIILRSPYQLVKQVRAPCQMDSVIEPRIGTVIGNSLYIPDKLHGCGLCQLHLLVYQRYHRWLERQTWRGQRGIRLALNKDPSREMWQLWTDPWTDPWTDQWTDQWKCQWSNPWMSDNTSEIVNQWMSYPMTCCVNECPRQCKSEWMSRCKCKWRWIRRSWSSSHQVSFTMTFIVQMMYCVMFTVISKLSQWLSPWFSLIFIHFHSHFHWYSHIHSYLHPFTRKFTQSTNDSWGSWKLTWFMAETDAQRVLQKRLVQTLMAGYSPPR